MENKHFVIEKSESEQTTPVKQTREWSVKKYHTKEWDPMKKRWVYIYNEKHPKPEMDRLLHSNPKDTFEPQVESKPRTRTDIKKSMHVVLFA